VGVFLGFWTAGYPAKSFAQRITADELWFALNPRCHSDCQNTPANNLGDKSEERGLLCVGNRSPIPTRASGGGSDA
jgi:hypothetical protein